MLQLLSPLALVALVSLAIPAALHLWRPPAKTIRVGTLQYFTGPGVRRLNKLRWRERLLLAVRLLLLTLLVLLLAQPIWKSGPHTSPQRWALLERGVALQGEELKRWRELDSADFQPRELAHGFRKLGSTEVRSGAKAAEVDVWSLLREVDARLPAGSKVAVFSAGRFVDLRGERPTMRNCEVEWVDVPRSGSATRGARIESIQAPPAEGNGPGELRAWIATGDVSGTQRTRIQLSAIAGRTPLTGSLSGWAIEMRENPGLPPSARLVRNEEERSPEEWISVTEVAPLRVAILHGADRAEDARYLEAAIRAVAEAESRSAVFSSEPARADWLFWLKDESPPPEILREVSEREANLLSDAENSGTAVTEASSKLLPVVSGTFSGDAINDVRLFRRTASNAETGPSVWTDQGGTPVLTVAKEGRGLRWRFFSRFHPDWNELPESSALPAALRSIFAVGDGGARGAGFDLRQIDPSQSRPADVLKDTSARSLKISPPPEIVDLRGVFWILCVALFALERVFSHRTREIYRRSTNATQSVPEEALVGSV